MALLSFKIKHNRDFSAELVKARKVAEFALTRAGYRFTSKDVKQIGLNANISGEILRKYARTPGLKKIHNALLTIPGQAMRVLPSRELYIPSLKLTLDISHLTTFTKICQVECNKEYAYVTVTVPEKPVYEPTGFIGIDRNTTGHVVVAANPATGKVWKLGKQCKHIREKYSNIRRRLQTQGRHKEAKELRNREKHIIKNINHNIAKKVVEVAVQNACGIRMEQLEGIKNKVRRQTQSFRYSFASWSYAELQEFIEYKAKLNGVTVEYVDPAYTSQLCSRCGSLGDRNGKSFACPKCGHVDHADVNASFVIASRPPLGEGSGRFKPDRDGLKGSIGTLQEAPANDADRRSPHKRACHSTRCRGGKNVRP